MAKLTFKQPFTLEVGDAIYSGTLNHLSKEQKKEFDKKSEQLKSQLENLGKQVKAYEKLKRSISIAEKCDDWEEVRSLEKDLHKLESALEKLNNKIEEDNLSETMFKDRIEFSVESDNKQDILEAGNIYGYGLVFETILKGVEEYNAKK